MTLFLLRRILGFAATLFMAALIIFLLLDLLPGDPARFIAIRAKARQVPPTR